MHRSRYATGFLLAPIVMTLACFTLACGVSAPEKTLLDRFFSASKYRDASTLAGISMVAFNKVDEGVVENFSVVSVTEEQSVPLQLKTLATAHQAAIAADADYSKRMRAFQDANGDAIKRVLDAEAKGRKLAGKDAEIQAAWLKWREDQKVLSKAVSEAKQKMGGERDLADLSTANPQAPVDPTTFDGTLVTKEYTVSANVTTPQNQRVRKTLVITLQRVVLKSGSGDITGKWIITKIRDATAGTTS